jgi:hypothetical protein
MSMADGSQYPEVLEMAAYQGPIYLLPVSEDVSWVGDEHGGTVYHFTPTFRVTRYEYKEYNSDKKCFVYVKAREESGHHYHRGQGSKALPPKADE